MKTVSLDQVGGEELALPARVQEVLGELVGSAKEGLLALSVGVGLGVLAELLEEEVAEVVGPKGKHIADRTAVRHGREVGEVTLGGRRVGVERPRVRTADGAAEVRLATYEYFADRDPLSRSLLERMLAGVSTRRYRRTQEPVGREVEQQARSTSKSSVSRTFVERTRRSLGQLMSRRLDDVRLAVMMIDGIDLGERTNVVALGITTEGVKIPLGLWEGSTENAAVATALLSDLVERGLDPEQGILFVIDGAKALRKAVRTVFDQAPVQRCVRHKERNVLDHLPERERPAVKQRLRRAWALDDHPRARPTPLARQRARANLSRCRRLAPRGDRGNADAHPARCAWQPEAHARINESVRVDDRDRPPHPAEREALVVRGDGAALDRRRHARSTAAVSEHHLLPRTRQPRHRDRTQRPSTPSPRRGAHPDQGGVYARHCLTVTPGPPPKSTARGTSSALATHDHNAAPDACVDDRFRGSCS